MPHIGYYINLDGTPDRRAFMEEQLARLDPVAPYRRFPAVVGNPRGFASPTLNDAQLGCFTSHYLVLEPHIDGADHLHIIEDDTVLAHRTVSFVEQIVASEMLDDFDILFTSTYLPEDFRSFRDGRDAWRNRIDRAADGTATDVQFVTLPYYAATASYLVNRYSVRLVHDMIGQELARGADMPIDLFIRTAAEQGRLRVQCLFPFITSVSPAQFASTIDRDDDKGRWTLVMDLLRHSFFVECDLKATLDLAAEMLPNSNADVHQQLHVLIAGFLASDLYRTF